MRRKGSLTLAGLLVQLAACQSLESQCAESPELCTWSLESGSVSPGLDYKLQVKLNDRLSAASLLDTLPVQIAQRTSGASLHVELVQTQGLISFAGSLAASELRNFQSGWAQISVSDAYSEAAYLHPLDLIIKSQLRFTPITTPYVDKDADPNGSNDTFQLPIRVAVTHSPPSGSSSSVNIISLQRGKSGNKDQRKIKLLQFDPNAKSLSLATTQPLYAKPYLYNSSPSPAQFSLGELPPTIAAFSDQVMIARDNAPGYDLYQCKVDAATSTESTDCKQHIKLPLLPQDQLPASTKSFASLDAGSAGVLFAYANDTGSSLTLSTFLLPPGSTITQSSWQPATPPSGSAQRILLEFGNLLVKDQRALLAVNLASQNVSGVSVYKLDAQKGGALEQPTNLASLLSGKAVQAIAVGLVDEDDLADIVYAVDGKLYFLINQGSQSAPPNMTSFAQDAFPIATGASISSLAIADVNGDRSGDVVVAQETQKTVTIFLNDNTP